MTHHAILTALGTDRPGLVDEVSQFIFEHGGNIEDSRMVNLRGQFAIMLLLGVWSFLSSNGSASTDLSQDFEKTMFAAIDQNGESW